MGKSISGKSVDSGKGGYEEVLAELVSLLEEARRTAARSVNAIITATYWEIGRRIVEYEQGGHRKAQYGKKLIERLATDLGKKFGRGYSVQNLRRMRFFYLNYRHNPIQQTPSVELERANENQIRPTVSVELKTRV